MASLQTRLALKKGRDLYILSRLVLNYVLLLRLKLYKWLHGIKRPIVHYYAVCWNEEKMLPFVFDHYDSFVDRFCFYDNHSTDRSCEIINAHPHTRIIQFDTQDVINDAAYKRIKDSCWKQSRGKADYVVVCDVDEFLYHPDMDEVLRTLSRQHISLPTTVGYEMYHPSFPRYPDDSPLVRTIHKGVQSHWLDKQLLFDPHRIVEINFEEGAHHCHPWGVVSRGSLQFKVLHYKHMGADYLLDRYAAMAGRLSNYNRTHKLGLHYFAKEKELLAEMEQGLREAQPVIV